MRRLAALLAVALAACSAPKASLPPSSCGREPAEVLACVRQREEAVTTMRARFNATSDSKGEHTTTSGVVLVAKPDRFRLRLMLPFGLTVFDAVDNAGKLQMSLPLQGGEITDAQRAPLPFSQTDLEETFLRGAYAFPGTCAASAGEGDQVVVRCTREDGRTRILHLDAKTATTIDEQSFTSAAESVDGQPHFTVAYSDYRLTPGSAFIDTPGIVPTGDRQPATGDPASGPRVEARGSTVLPYRIRLAYPARRISLDIEIEKYEVNPTLAPGLFRPIEP